MAKDKETVEIKLTPSDVAELIRKKTGKNVSTDSHWFSSIIENTRELPPYSLITLRATPR